MSCVCTFISNNVQRFTYTLSKPLIRNFQQCTNGYVNEASYDEYPYIWIAPRLFHTYLFLKFCIQCMYVFSPTTPLFVHSVPRLFSSPSSIFTIWGDWILTRYESKIGVPCLWIHKPESIQVSTFSNISRLFLLICSLINSIIRCYVWCTQTAMTEFSLFVSTVGSGGMLLRSANDLVTVYVASECLGPSSYLLSGYAKIDDRSGHWPQ